MIARRIGAGVTLVLAVFGLLVCLAVIAGAWAIRRPVDRTADAGIATLILLTAGASLVAVVTTSPEVRAVADTYLPWAAFTALSGVLAFQMDGVFIGATWSRDMRNMMLLSFLVFSAALITLAPAFGNNGLWASLHVFLLVRGVSLLAVLRLRVRTAF